MDENRVHRIVVSAQLGALHSVYNLRFAQQQESEQFEHYLEDLNPRHLREIDRIEAEIRAHGL